MACDDPGAAISAQLALPLLQERLYAQAMEFAAACAAEADQAILMMKVRRTLPTPHVTKAYTRPPQGTKVQDVV